MIEMTPEIKKRIEQLCRSEIPEGYKKTKAGILPSDWDEHTLGDCLSRVERPVEVKPNELYTQIGIRSHWKGLFYKEPVAGAALGNKAVFWIEPDCFIVNIVFAWEQAIGKTTQSEVGMIGSHRFPMYRPVNDRVDIDYLISYFLTKRGTDILEAASPGGAGRNKTLGQERFLKSKIVLPPIEEQQKIAAILTTQDRVIELKEKRLAEKQRQKKYLMQQLLTGKKRLPGFSGAWKKVHLRDLFVYAKKHSTGPSVTYVSSENMLPNLSGTVVFGAEDRQVGGIEYKSGDILIGNIRPYLKKIWLADRSGICSTDVLVLHPLESGLANIYNFIATDRFFSYIMLGAGGSRMPRGDKRQIMEYELALPDSEDEKERLFKILSDVELELDLLRQSIEQERQKKKALMQLLLTGIVRVRP